MPPDEEAFTQKYLQFIMEALEKRYGFAFLYVNRTGQPPSVLPEKVIILMLIMVPKAKQGSPGVDHTR